MTTFKLTAAESRFADLIWQNAPIHSPRLAEIAMESMNWKKIYSRLLSKQL